AKIVAGRIRDVALDLDAGGLRAAGKAPLAGALAHAAPDVERESVEPIELGEPHARFRRAAATTPSTTCSAPIPAPSAEKLIPRRWRSAGTATRSTSSRLTCGRPASSARTFAPRMSAWPPRGLDPYVT